VSSVAVVVDACVLIKASVRDTLIRAYGAGLYLLHWTDDILAEIERNLAATGMTTPEGAERLAAKLREALADARVSGHERLIPSMTNDPKDRHGLAAAVASGSRLIVTDNLKDFPVHAVVDHGIEACGPDEFLVGLFETNPSLMAEIVEIQARVLRRPPLTTAQVLVNLTRDGVPTFAGLVRA